MYTLNKVFGFKGVSETKTTAQIKKKKADRKKQRQNKKKGRR